MAGVINNQFCSSRLPTPDQKTIITNGAANATATTTAANIPIVLHQQSPLLGPITLLLLKAFLDSAALVIAAIFPLPTLPEPDGAWGCGVEEFQLTSTAIHQVSLLPLESAIIPRDRSDSTGLPNSGRSSDAVSSPAPPSSSLPPSSMSSASSRPFQALVFYPIEKHRHSGESRYRWLSGGREMTRALGKAFGLPSFLFRYLTRVETSSVVVAPLSKKRRKFPVVFISHGVAMTKTSHLTLCQTLASHGFIVVALEHTDGTAISTTVPFQRLEPKTSKLRLLFQPRGTDHHDHHHLKDNDDEQVRNDAQALAELIAVDAGAGPAAAAAAAEISRLARKRRYSNQGVALLSPRPSKVAMELDFRRAQLLVRTAEIRAAYDALFQMSRTWGCWIKDRIDWDSSAVVGFGFGAASALLACIVNHVEATAKETEGEEGREFQEIRSPFPTSCILVCPWLECFRDSELKLTEWLKLRAPAALYGKPLPEGGGGDGATSLETASLNTSDSGGNLSTSSLRRAEGGRGALLLRTPALRLPQNFLILNTSEQNTQTVHKQIRFIKLIKEARGEKRILQFSRCQKLDATDWPYIAPSVVRYLGISGPRDPAKTGQMINRVACNFLYHHYRRALFTTSEHSRARGAMSLRQRVLRQAVRGVGSESETTMALAPGGGAGATSDASSTVAQPSFSARRAYQTSTIQALRLAGISNHYLRGLGGLKMPLLAKELGRLFQPGKQQPGGREEDFDIRDGVAEFCDQQDRGSGVTPPLSAVAEMCRV